MKLNDQPIEIERNPELDQVLINIFESIPLVTTAIETGTYLGTGSTKVIINAYENSVRPIDDPFCFYTLEGNIDAYRTARVNLSFWDYVQPLHAISVTRDEAMSFIQNDTFLEEKDKYPDIYCDSNGDLKHFYMTETQCCLDSNPKQGLLRELINQFRDEEVLFILDSSGGIGKLEFDIVQEEMGYRGYYLMCDDLNHLKHYRSWKVIEANEDGKWEILYTDGRVGVFRRHGE